MNLLRIAHSAVQMRTLGNVSTRVLVYPTVRAQSCLQVTTSKGGKIKYYDRIIHLWPGCCGGQGLKEYKTGLVWK